MPTARSLPWYPGPKLHPFQFTDPERPEIEFLGRLGSGAHSIVHKVRIDGTVYALKTFRFFHPRDLAPQNWIDSGFLDLHTVTCECDPFYSECRAYGRLLETGYSNLAIQCYGYLFLDELQEKQIVTAGQVDNHEWQRRDVNKSQPLRCIVKEYITQDTPPFSFNMIPKMRLDIKKINQLGILVYDLREGNYMGGRLVDFSQAYTTPHYALDLHSSWLDCKNVRDECVRDLICFDSMMDDWNTANPSQKYWKRFLPNRSFGFRLRNASRYETNWGDREGANLDVALYDWKRPKNQAG